MAESLRPIVQEQIVLLELTAGYTTLVSYVQKKLQEHSLTGQLSLTATLLPIS